MEFPFTGIQIAVTYMQTFNNMKLTIKDRVVILNTLIPMYDTRVNTKVKIAISEKLKLTDTEKETVVVTPLGNNQSDISFKTAEAITSESEFIFEENELEYLRSRVDFVDRNGMFSESTIDTYDKILDCEP